MLLIRSDLEFILQQIVIAERHAAGEDLLSLLPNVQVPFGLRTVDGTYNNLVPGQSGFGAADTIFPRLTDPAFRPAESGTSYQQTSGTVVDSQPRIISNLIVDMTANNPAAVAAAAGTAGRGHRRQPGPRRHVRHRRRHDGQSSFPTSRPMTGCRRRSTPG